jgi:hypothetical protein
MMPEVNSRKLSDQINSIATVTDTNSNAWSPKLSFHFWGGHFELLSDVTSAAYGSGTGLATKQNVSLPNLINHSGTYC